MNETYIYAIYYDTHIRLFVIGKLTLINIPLYKQV